MLCAEEVCKHFHMMENPNFYFKNWQIMSQKHEKHHNLFLNTLHFHIVEVKAVNNFRDFPLSYIVLFICNYSLSALDNAVVPTAVYTSINH